MMARMTQPPRSWRPDPDRWPHLTAALPGTGGRIREAFEDFQVDEVPARAPAGDGEHLHVQFRKADYTTRWLIDHLRRELGLDGEAIGHAGMKDRRAVTTQWLSLPASSLDDLPDVALPDGIALLRVERHATKLQEGDLAGNRFAIRVRGAAGQADAARAIMAELAAQGVPNYYGPQRFGTEGDNAERGLLALKKGLKPRGWLDKLRTQAVQSFLFNDWLAARLAGGTFATVLLGDIAHKHATGGKFQVGDVAAEAPRAAAFEISATGPMFGKKYHEAHDDARQIEEAVLAAMGVDRALFKPLPGTRRPIRVPLADWAIEEAEDGYVARFFLPAGGYATSVLREVMKTEMNEDASSADEPPIS